MYRKNRPTSTVIRCNESTIGERIEEKMRRLIREKAPISDLAPEVFTERKEGVKAEYNIRTDKWEQATEAREKVVEQRELFKKAKAEGKVVKLNEQGKQEIVPKSDGGEK